MSDLLTENGAAVIVAIVSISLAVLNHLSNVRLERLKLRAAELAAHNADTRKHRLEAFKEIMGGLAQARLAVKQFANPFSGGQAQRSEALSAVASLRSVVDRNSFWLPKPDAERLQQLVVELSNVVTEVCIAQETNGEIELWGEAWKKVDGPLIEVWSSIEQAARAAVQERATAQDEFGLAPRWRPNSSSIARLARSLSSRDTPA